ncbi:MAG TPA: DUF664 domain-containing protein [Streptosporangiaceae bacterium]|nr:DUF664 domain-containing protein [Streptosporangiaceae bacterium]
MTGTGARIIGSLRMTNGKGTVRVADRYDTDIDDLWSALTEPRRLTRWIGDVKGDLRLGGEFHARLTSSWEGPGRVDVCEPPRRLLLTMSPGQRDETVIEARLTADGDQTMLVIEERGFTPNELAAHGAGWQAHAEDLAAHVAGREPADWRGRWTELTPAYRDLAGDPVWQAERAALMGFLQAQRRSVLAIIEGLDEDSIRTAVVPSGWTPLGVIQHLGHAERLWFQKILTGTASPLPWPPNESGPFVTAHPLDEVLDFYRNQCAISDENLASTALTAGPAGEVPSFLSVADEIHTVRDMILHMIEETARHAGHLDLARELIDGRTGLGPR